MHNESVPSVLRKVMTRPSDGSGETVDDVVLTPDIAEHILTEMNHETDRTIGRYHADRFADLMRKDEVLELQPAVFALDADGNPKLVEGHVLFEAAVLAGWTGRWIVVCHWAEKFSADKLYTSLRAGERVRALDAATKEDVAQRLRTRS